MKERMNVTKKKPKKDKKKNKTKQISSV